MEIKSVKVTLDWHLFVDCPNCGTSFDIVDEDIDDDNVVATAIFTNKWDNLKGYEVDCVKCNKTFKIEKVEY